jgi:putative membrane protein
MFEYMNMNMTMFHGFGMLVFWVIVFYLLFSLFNSKKKDMETPFDILKKRLAKGEITKEQFDSIKKTIQ